MRCLRAGSRTRRLTLALALVLARTLTLTRTRTRTRTLTLPLTLPLPLSQVPTRLEAEVEYTDGLLKATTELDDLRHVAATLTLTRVF